MGTIPTASITETEIRIRTGSVASFKCIVTGKDVISIWSKENGLLPYRSNTQNGVLIIPSVTYSDEGVYICVGKNVYGEAQAKARLIVIDGK